MNKIIAFIFLTFIFNFSFAQSKVFFDKTYQDSIKTVQLKPVNTQFSYPIINLGSSERLKLSFDDLNSDNQVFSYYYTFIHCNADWTKSDLYFEDYCDGFEDNRIYEYDNSFNTLQDYVNYFVEFPNDDISFLTSGNYIIMVYADGEKEDTVLTKRFSIYENLATIEGSVKVPGISAYRTTNQEVNFKVKSQIFDKFNPLQYVSITVSQNNRPDIAKVGLKPRFINGNELIFDDPFQNSYYAGNEFRYFDVQSIRFESEKVTDIEIIDSYYSFFLVPEPERTKYFFHKDINGSYVIQNSLGREPDNDADYVFVYFSYPREYPYPNNDVYIYGELSNWDYLPEFKMNYNKSKKVYEKAVLVKQGYYNYELKLKPESEILKIDGNYFDTENDYVIYVYLRDNLYNYDKLIGVKILSN
ncbi:MAG: DUF5103 domain-containing protein [Bacteroidales bacterium]|nr:DUF5103 domain-containing protein [Bacteroidales bacterium]